MHQKTFGVSIPRNHILEIRLDLEILVRKRITLSNWKELFPQSEALSATDLKAWVSNSL